MIRILVVDDEVHITDWLSDMLKNLEYGQLEVHKAYSAFKALNIMESLRIDIVLLDIKMPKMTGLELSGKIKANWPKCKFIFLTGHNDFSFIYEAEKMQPVKYLLKTEDDSVIIEAVNLAIKEVENLSLLDSARQSKSMVDFLVGRAILNDMLNNHSKKNNQHSLEDTFLIYGVTGGNTSFQDSYDLYSYISHLVDIFYTCLDDMFTIFATEIGDSQILFALKTNINLFQGTVTPTVYLQQNLDNAIVSCNLIENHNIKMFLYEEAVSSKDILLASQNLMSACSRLYFNNYKRDAFVYTLKKEDMVQATSDKPEAYKSLNKTVDALSFYLFQSDRVNFFKEFEKYEIIVKERYNFVNASSAKCYLSLSMVFLNFIERYQHQYALTEVLPLNRLYSPQLFSNWSECCTFFRQTATAIFDLIENEGQDYESALIQEIKLFIKEKFSTDINLTIISNHVSYSNSYVSRIFNELEGVSITTYINQIRIEKAKELLEQTNFSVQEIIDRIGFETPQYFSLVFKKAEGMSPREYRHMASK